MNLPEKLVFGLDIGTRSIVGTVGYMENKEFHVVVQYSLEHETRAMIDGQIHDIKKVGETITAVKCELERQLGRPLNDVSIAAAGRVLKTVTTKVEIQLPEECIIDSEHIYSLDLLGIEQAQKELYEKNDTDIGFYCVGYSVIHYYQNDYLIGNLEGHMATRIAEELIATFLPTEVVDGLYAAVELAGLRVANLTLEPIAAIQVAIPEKFRLLNIGLVDVGAGTSDICLTKDGSITAYGMIPMAGDELTETIAKQYLVDFDMAEHIKTSVRECYEMPDSSGAYITYHDIIGIEHQIEPQEVCDLLEDILEEETSMVAERIIELNGGKSVSAVFIVGGGGKFPGYTDKLAQHLKIPKERVVLRGEEVLGNVHFHQTHIKKDSLLVTPIGICLNSYEKKNKFIFVYFNEERIKLFNNNRLTVMEAAMQAGFPNENLFPRRGDALNFTLNEVPRMVRGEVGEAAVVTIDGNIADINTPINSNDRIVITPSSKGKKARLKVEQLEEFHDTITVIVNGSKVICPKFVQVNEELVSGFYNIQNEDKITILNYYTLQQMIEFMDLHLPSDIEFLINNRHAELSDRIYDNFTVDWKQKDTSQEEDLWTDYSEDEDIFSGYMEDDEEVNQTFKVNSSVKANSSGDTKDIHDPNNVPLTVLVNGNPVVLTGKPNYIYVDIFDFIDFDLTKPHGSYVVTKLNGVRAQYAQKLQPNDNIEIYWED